MQRIYTTGHSNHEVETFLDLLNSMGLPLCAMFVLHRIAGTHRDSIMSLFGNSLKRQVYSTFIWERSLDHAVKIRPATLTIKYSMNF